MDIHSKIIVSTTLDENGNVVRKCRFENSFEALEGYLSAFLKCDRFVMESTGFYQPLYDFIESHGFNVELANPLKIRLIAESKVKNDDVDSEVLAKLLRNNWIPRVHCTWQAYQGDARDCENRNTSEERSDKDEERDQF